MRWIGYVAAAVLLALAAAWSVYQHPARPELPAAGTRRCDELQLRAAILDAEACERYWQTPSECQAAAIAKNCDTVQQ